MLSKVLSILFTVYSAKWLKKKAVSVQEPKKKKKNIPHSSCNLKSTQSEKGKLREGVGDGGLVSRGRGGKEAEILF